MSIRLIRVLTRFGAGGPPLHCLIATRELRKRGYDATLVIGRCGPADGDMSYLMQPDDPVIHMESLAPHASLADDVGTLFSLWRMFRRSRPQVVHTHTAWAGALGRIAAWLAGVPVIVHTYHGHVLKDYFAPWKSRLLLYIERILGGITDCICVLASQQEQELGDELAVAPKGKFRVVRLGIDLEPFVSLPDAPPDGPIRIGWLGRLVPIKNVPLLIQVIDQILETHPTVQFLIAGDGSERHLLESALPRWSSRVEWMGWAKDVTKAIEPCHILLQTSLSEGTPVSLIQGMAARRPFVATAVGGIPDMADGERNGLLCAPDAREIAKALTRLIEDGPLRRGMGLQAADFARRHFASERMTADLDTLYQGLLAEHAPALVRSRAVETI